MSFPAEWVPNGALLRRVLPDGTEMEVRQLDPHDIRTDREYQRPLNRARVRRYAASWSDLLAFAVTVSHRGPSDYVVVDGQHRVAAALEAGVARIPCLVVSGLTRRDEAALFTALSMHRVGLNTRERFRARWVAGDPVCADIVQAVETCGFHLNLGERRSLHHDWLESVATLEQIYRRGPFLKPRQQASAPVSAEEGMMAIERVLQTIQACFPAEVAAKQSDMLEGVHTFWLYYADAVSLEALAAKVRATTAADILRRAAGSKQTIGGSRPLWVAHLLLQQYNSGRRSGRLPNRLPAPGSFDRRQGAGDA